MSMKIFLNIISVVVYVKLDIKIETRFVAYYMSGYKVVYSSEELSLWVGLTGGGRMQRVVAFNQITIQL